jgi:hypothetical protein
MDRHSSPGVGNGNCTSRGQNKGMRQCWVGTAAIRAGEAPQRADEGHQDQGHQAGGSHNINVSYQSLEAVLDEEWYIERYRI